MKTPLEKLIEEKKKEVQEKTSEIIVCEAAWSKDDGPMAWGNATTPHEILFSYLSEAMTQAHALGVKEGRTQDCDLLHQDYREVKP